MEKNETCEIVQPELNGLGCSDSSASESESESEDEEIDNNNNNNKSNRAVIKNPKRVMFANVMDATELVSGEQNDINEDVMSLEESADEDETNAKENGYYGDGSKVRFSYSVPYLDRWFESRLISIFNNRN